MKAFDEKNEYLMKMIKPIVNGYENILENGAFAHYVFNGQRLFYEVKG